MGGQTLVEKIASRHCVGGRPRPPRAGDLVTLRPRHLLTHDNSAAIIDQFMRTGADSVRYPWQALIALDHDVQNTDPRRLAVWRRIQDFARRQRIEFRPCGSGVGHQIMVEGGYVIPGSLCVAADSHANLYGALGALGTAIVRSDAAAIWATGEFWWEIPRSIEVRLEGSLPDEVSGKDLILALCSRFSSGEVLGAALEFTGPGVSALGVDDRFAVSNMTTEWGAVAGIFPVDRRTLAYLDEVRRELTKRGRRRFTREQLEAWSTDPEVADHDAEYAARITVDLGSVGRTVNGPASPLADAGESGPVRIDKAYLAGCANARLSDLRAAADVIRGRKVHPRVHFYVAAASRAVQDDAVREGIWDDLLAAGARTLPPGCAMCIGLGEGLLEPGEVGISATNRNYPGRLGAPGARAWLASPVVVARAALEGQLDPSAGRGELRAEFGAGSSPGPPRPAAPPMAGFPERIAGGAVFLPGDDLDTDRIYPSRALYEELGPEEMRAHLFADHDPGFAERIGTASLLVGGFNFGCGSSREQAVTALQAAGIRLVVAGSFAGTFRRNALNHGLLILEVPAFVAWLAERAGAGPPRPLELEVDFRSAVLRAGAREFGFAPVAPMAQELCLEGGILARVRRRFAGEKER